MGLFDRKAEKNKADKMTKTQKDRQKHAIWNYYKDKNKSSFFDKSSKKKK